MEKNFYQAYGLSIVSDFEIDAFQKVDEFQKDRKSLQIVNTIIDFEGYSFEDNFVLRKQIESGFLYVIKNVVAFLITENQMKVFPMVKNPKVWQSFLIGGAMSIVLNIREYFLLHGSAVESNKVAYLFLGLSGVGKSSIATALEQKTYGIITDDICALSIKNNNLYINPGTQQARLLKDTVELLGIKEITALEHPNVKPKYGYHFAPINVAKTNVKRIIELVVDDRMEKEICIERIESFEKIKLLEENIYKKKLSIIVKGEQHNFQSIMKAVNEVECFQLKRKRAKYNLKELADLIEQEIIQKP